MKDNHFLIRAAALILCFIPALVAAEKKERYFSPNNDGVLDEFVIPLKISDKRYITSWQLVIVDETGNTVRTIGNKVALPRKLGFKSFFTQLGAVKKGVDIPESVSWNGAMDNGETAPDGTYFYYFTASDDNGNEGKTDLYPVVIDTVAPMIALTQPSDKIFGEGTKSEFRIRQTGSIEDEWTGKFKNAAGETVRTFTWTDAEPADFKWDGTDDNGRFVPDGVYSYDVGAVDRAGNTSETALITNIIYSAEKPATNIMLVGTKYVSPGTDSPLSSIKFDLQIPVPEEKSGNKLTDWSVKITDAAGKVYRVYNQSSSSVPPSEIIFDGKDGDGKILPQGIYQAAVAAHYLNGYEPAELKSPEFVLDVTKPSAQISVSDTIFGAGSKTHVRISILPDIAGKYAPVPSWKGRIFPADNPSETVKEYDFGEFPPEAIEWNGFTSDGALAADGVYAFELRATDLAGNTGTASAHSTFELNTKEAKILLSLSSDAFSPNGDKVKEKMEFVPVIKDAAETADYTCTIRASDGTSVRTIKGSGKLPEKFVWDGKDESGIVCADGMYTVLLSVNSANGAHSQVLSNPFALDTVPPKLEAAAPWSAFSPDGDGNQDVIPVTVTNCTNESVWKAEVVNAAGKPVRTYTWKSVVRTNGKDGFEWDGTDENGNKTSDGIYTIVISSEDEAGNAFSTKISEITLDTRETKIYLTAEHEGISPNGDGILDSQIFSIRTSVPDGILSWNFDIRSENGVSVRSWSDKDSANLPASITWDGLDANGNTADGTFTGTLKTVYKKGNKIDAVSAPFICTAVPPQLTVRTAPEYFSPDNDGTDDDLFIKLTATSKAALKNWSFVINSPSGNPFWTTKGTSAVTERIIWDGLSNVQKDSAGRAERVQSAMDYPYTFTVTDVLGMTSVAKGLIPVDVLVIRDGDVLKMAVPSIIFRSDNADFKTTAEVGKGGLEPSVSENNERVLNRIAEILNKFKDYRVLIVGHANRVTDDAAEETEDNMRLWGPALGPLSGKRAEFVKEYLVKKGVSANRLTTDGKGGTELVVDYKDKDNNWKNRRVEFILEK